MAVMVYFEQPETRKCYINTCEQHIFYNMCYYKAVEYKLYQTWYHYSYLWTTHLLQYVHVATELLRWAALNSHYRYVVNGLETGCV